MQQALNPALARVLGVMDSIKPVTPQGTPTVASQVMQAAGMEAQPPAMPDVAQQAGIGAEVQGMQMEDAQENLLNAARQQQQQQPVGIEALNPQMGAYAEGGIVGYSGEEESYVAEPAQGGGVGALVAPAPQSAWERKYAEALAAHRASQDRNVNPEAVAAEVQGMTAQQRKFLESQGINPDYLRVAAEEATRRGDERSKYYETRAQDMMRDRQRRGIIDFLRGAQGLAGQGIGAVLASGAGAARAGDVAAEQAADALMEKRLQAQDAAVKDRMLLDKARYEIASGQFESARKTLEEREKSRQQYQMREATMLSGQAKEMAELERHEADRKLRERELGARASSDKRMQLQALTTQQSTLVQQINRLQSDLANAFKKDQKAQLQADLASLTSDLTAVREQLRVLGGMPAAPSAAKSEAQGKVENWADIVKK